MILNTLILSFGQLLAKALSTFWTFYLARRLGVDLFGRWANILALASIFNVFRDFGSSTILVREVSRDKGRAAAFFGNSLVFYSLLGGLTLAGMTLCAAVLRYPADKVLLVTLAGFSFLLSAPALAAQAVLYGLEDFYSYMKYYGLGTLVYVACGIGLVEGGYSVAGAILGLCVGNAAASAFLFWKLARACGPPILRPDFSLWKLLLGAGLLLTLGQFVSEISNRSDRLIIEKFLGESAVGLYHSAFVLAMIPREVFLIPLVGAFYPRLSSAYLEDKKKFGWTFGKMSFIALALSLPVPCILAWVSAPVIQFVYGPDYQYAAPALSLLLCALPPMFLSGIGYQVFLVQKKESWFLWANLFQMGVALLINFLLVPRIGMAGSAYAFLAAQVLAWLLVGSLVRRECEIISWRRLGRLLAAAAAAGGASYLLRDHPFWIAAAVGACVYVLGLFLLRAFDPDEVAWIKGKLSLP